MENRKWTGWVRDGLGCQLLGVVALVLVAAGCTSGGDPTCELDSDCPAHHYCLSNTCVDGGKDDVIVGEILQVGWGQGKEELGRIEPEEGNSEGPMSFALAPNDEIYVLDQANSRIQVYSEGVQVRAIPVPGETFDDIELAADGSIALLDRLVRAAVVFLDPDGNETGEVGLRGEGVIHPGLINLMHWRADGVWVEVEGRLVRISDAANNPAPERISVPGVLSADGTKLISMQLPDQPGAVVTITPVDSPGAAITVTVPFGVRPELLMGPWMDDAGRTCLAARILIEQDVEPFDVVEDSVEVVVLGPDGSEKERMTLPPPSLEEEIFRSLRFTASGEVIQLGWDETGIVIRRVEP